MSYGTPGRSHLTAFAPNLPILLSLPPHSPILGNHNLNVYSVGLGI